MEKMKNRIKQTKGEVASKLRHTSSAKIIPAVFFAIILAGALLLMLPISQKGEGGASFIDALFTATSATCVTGLVRFDTYTHWTTFGQLVILSMIQIGGLGFMTIAVWIMSFTGYKIGLNSRFVVQNSLSAPQVGGMVKLTRFILLGTAVVEGLGAVLLAGIFIPRYGWGEGIYFSIFHSISAFCNAGFDLMGGEEPFSSLTLMGDSWYLNLIIMALIIIGGLGFMVWKDLLQCRFRFKKLRLHTKIVVVMTAFLIISGTVVIFFMEYGETGTEGKSVSEQFLNALFQSVTVRTAGFNTVDLTKMTEPSIFLDEYSDADRRIAGIYRRRY